MIAGILVAGLVAALAGAWLYVELITYLHAGTRAFNRYTDTHPEDLPKASPHARWDTSGSRKHRSGDPV